MDRNTKILAAVFGACLVYVLYVSVAYPLWLKPLLVIDDRIAEREQELDKLETKDAEVHQAKLEYRAFLERIGSFDELNVQNDLRERLNDLVARYKLESVGISPSRPTTERKTKITTMHITVTAVGTLESAIGFLADMAELPHLLRVGNTSIYPVSSSRKNKRKSVERVNIRAPIEVKVLPHERMLGERLHDEDLKQPVALVRHEDRDYSAIWTGTPFTEFIPLKPLEVEAGTDVNVDEGRRASLNGRVKGGDGEYTWQWSPDEGLDDATSPRPKVDTAEAFTRTYTLTVKDESGNSHEDSVTVTIKEKHKAQPTPKVTKAEPKAVPPPPRDKRWKGRKDLQLCMTFMRSDGDLRIEELMVFDRKTRENKYYPLMAEFDGGTLVSVHPRGGVVRRDDRGEPAYFVYPIGANLNEDIRAEDAGDFPVLQRLALRVRDSEAATLAAEESDGDGEQDAGKAEPDGAEDLPGEPAELQPGSPSAGEESAVGAKPDDGKEDKPASGGPGEPAKEAESAAGELVEKTTDTKPGSVEDEKTNGTKPALPKPGAKAGGGKPVSKKVRAKPVSKGSRSGDRRIGPARGKGAPVKPKAKTHSRKSRRGRSPTSKRRPRTAVQRKKERLEEIRRQQEKP